MMAGISKGGVAAAAKFKAGMGRYLASQKPAPKTRQPSGTGPGAAKFRKAMGAQVARSQPSAPKRAPSGTGPGVAKFKAGMSKYLGKAFGTLG